MESIFISAETYFFSMLIITYITQKLLKVYKEELFDDKVFYSSNIFVMILSAMNGSIVMGESEVHIFFSFPLNDYLILGASAIFIWHLYIFAVLCQRDKFKNF